MSDESSGPIKRTVKVAGVDTKSGGEDTDRPWTKYALVDEQGNRQSTFDKKMGYFLQSSVGKFVEIEVEKSGKYWNLLSAVPASAKPAAGPAAQPNGSGYSYSRNPESELRIAREAALHAVTRMYSGTNADIDSILLLADKAVRWIYDGLRPELVAAVPEKPVDAVERIAAEMERLGAAAPTGQLRVETHITNITVKAVNGGAGKRFTVSTSNAGVYYTFSETVARVLRQAKDDQAMVTLLVRETGFGGEIDEVVSVGGSLGRGEPIRGKPVTVPS